MALDIDKIIQMHFTADDYCRESQCHKYCQILAK